MKRTPAPRRTMKYTTPANPRFISIILVLIIASLVAIGNRLTSAVQHSTQVLHARPMPRDAARKTMQWPSQLCRRRLTGPKKTDQSQAAKETAARRLIRTLDLWLFLLPLRPISLCFSPAISAGKRSSRLLKMAPHWTEDRSMRT